MTRPLTTAEEGAKVLCQAAYQRALDDAEAEAKKLAASCGIGWREAKRIADVYYGPTVEQDVATALRAESRAATAEAEVERLRRVSDLFQAALANSGGPCLYCTLPKEDWAKCASGFPGCSRADDAMLCPNVGASLEADAEVEALRERVAKLERALKPFAEEADTLEETDQGHLWESPQAMALTTDHLRAARAALTGGHDAE